MSDPFVIKIDVVDDAIERVTVPKNTRLEVCHHTGSGEITELHYLKDGGSWPIIRPEVSEKEVQEWAINFLEALYERD